MSEIKNDCEKLLIHIKKCKGAMEWDGYTDAGIAGYFLKLPFKKVHRKHFAQIEIYTEKIDKYIKENDINLELETFEELNNTAILYGASQLSSLGYKQYEHRIKYLNNLKEKITELLEIIKSIEK